MRTAMCLAFVMAAAAGSAQAAGATPPAGPAEPAWPSPDWPAAAPAEVGLDAALLHQARDYALEGDGSGIILRHGRAVLRWGDPRALYDLKSSTKGIGVTALGLAMADGKVRSLDQPARTFHPTFGVPPEGNAATGWPERITLLHLATQTAGFAKPGGYTELLFQPGTKWSYSDGGPNWLAECLTLAYKKDVADLLFERVFEPIGIRRSDLVWRRNSYRPHEIDGLPRREFGSGISANVEAMSRIGYLYLRGGRWRDRQLLPREFVEMVRVVPEFVRGLPVLAPEQYGQASNHYGLLWWNNADGTLPDVPRDAYWTWGLYDSLTVVMPSLDLVIARAGKSLKRAAGGEHYGVLRPFLGAICRAATATAAAGPPCPPSPVIKQMAWAPPETIVRAARGSDNWPLTWGDDDALYGAYGDGRGFDPPVPQKLSMGLVRITGGPADFRGE
ncbi:MAG: serine hydrolase, partial [Planctomycetes bacterium]|nr:serine hydrolase [Planctomycetota bacterium]